MSAVRSTKCGLAGYSRAQRAQQLERALRLILVPQIDPVQLVVGLAAQQDAARVHGFHVAEAFLAIAARQQEQKPEEPGDRRCDRRVVLIEPDAESRVAQAGVERQRTFERLLDALAVAGRGEMLLALHPPRDPGPIRGTEIEPRFGGSGLAFRPALGRRDRGGHALLKVVVQAGVVGVDQDPPPRRRGVQHLAGLTRCGRAGAGQGFLGAIESRVQDLRVDRRQAIAAREGVPLGPGVRRREQRAGHRRRTRVPRQAHSALVFRRCFSA